MTFYFDLVVVIQEGNWWNFAYGSALLFICLVVCLIGAGTQINLWLLYCQRKKVIKD